MATTKTTTFPDYFLVTTQADDNSLTTLIVPKNPALNIVRAFYPTTGSPSYTVLVMTGPEATQVVADLVNIGNLPTNFPARVLREANHQRRAQRQAAIDAATQLIADQQVSLSAIQAEQAADPNVS